MDNAEFEEALETYLTAQLAALSNVTVLAGTKRATLPKERRTVLIACRDAGRIATQEPLYNPAVTLLMSTPVIKGMTVPMHSEMVKAVRWAVKPEVDDDHDQDAVDAAWAALDAAVFAKTKMHCRSGWLEGPKEGHDEQEWKTLSEMTWCVTKD